MNTHIDRLEVRVRREPFFLDRLDLLVFRRKESPGRYAVARGLPIVFEEETEFQSHCEPVPTLSLPVETGQQLMDELWRAGLRPTEGTGSAGAMAATQEHLKDMRRLVFEKYAPGQQVMLTEEQIRAMSAPGI